MMNYILFDESKTYNNLLPLTFTRPVSDLRIGILKISEKWNRMLDTTCSYKTRDYLQIKFPLRIKERNIFINSSVLPDKNLVQAINALRENEILIKENTIIAAFAEKGNAFYFSRILENINNFTQIPYNQNLNKIEKTTDFFTKNEGSLRNDFKLITQNRQSEKISETNNILGKENIFIEKGVTMEFATLNAKQAPIYIGKNSLIMEGALIRGGFACAENSVVKMGAKIYGATTIGKKCTIGGEIKNSIINDFSNKGHEGYLGDSVVGQWCNFGAGSNNSNLKNTFSEVKLWNYQKQYFETSGLTKCGLIMGDYTKCGINTMFNTGTIIGTACNIFGEDFMPNYIPSFIWGGKNSQEINVPDKFLLQAERTKKAKNEEMTEYDRQILKTVFELEVKN